MIDMKEDDLAKIEALLQRQRDNTLPYGEISESEGWNIDDQLVQYVPALLAEVRRLDAEIRRLAGREGER